jgi:hypothetical protein
VSFEMDKKGIFSIEPFKPLPKVEYTINYGREKNSPMKNDRKRSLTPQSQQFYQDNIEHVKSLSMRLKFLTDNEKRNLDPK